MQKKGKAKGNGQDHVLLPVGMRAGDSVRGRHFIGTLVPYNGGHGIFHIDAFVVREAVCNGNRSYRLLPEQVRFSTRDSSYVVWSYNRDGFTGKTFVDHCNENVPKAGDAEAIPSEMTEAFESMRRCFSITLTEKELYEFMYRGRKDNAVDEYCDCRLNKPEPSDQRKRALSVMTGVPFAGEERRASQVAAKTAFIMTRIKS